MANWNVEFAEDAIQCDGEMFKRAMTIINRMAGESDPRTFKDGNGGYVKALVGNLKGVFSFKPSIHDRYAEDGGNFRIEFQLRNDRGVIEAKMEIRGKNRVLFIRRVGDRAGAYQQGDQ